MINDDAVINNDDAVIENDDADIDYDDNADANDDSMKESIITTTMSAMIILLTLMSKAKALTFLLLIFFRQAAVHKDTRILYGCDECEKNFTSITNYRRHKIMIHGPGKQAYHCDR